MAAAFLLGIPAASHAQVIGSYDNFDCFNDTGETAEGFEIDVEDVAPADLTREFPSNFSATPWVTRYGIPTVTPYDFTAATPDPDHAYDAGHKGVLVTYAANLVNGHWTAPYGAQPFGAGTVAGDGTPFVANPTLTNGDSCWFYGLGAAYPTSGCDHFGISFAGGVAPGRITYHWKVPNPTNTALVNAKLEASIPPSPTLAPQPVAPGAPPIVHAVAGGPADVGGDPNKPQAQAAQFGDAFWMKVTTVYGAVDAQLDLLQKAKIAPAGTHKIVLWAIVQRTPGVGPNAGKFNREAIENDPLGKKNVQVTKQYEYFKFAGQYDQETHEVLCDAFYATQALALANGKKLQVSCQNGGGADTPFTKPYWVIDQGSGAALYSPTGNLGQYVGAHINAYNAK